MKYFIYLISNHNRKHIHPGYTTDLIKCMEFYYFINDNSLAWPVENKLNSLVYFEEVEKEGLAIDRFLLWQHLPLPEKIKEILQINPEWIDITPHLNQLLNGK